MQGGAKLAVHTSHLVKFYSAIIQGYSTPSMDEIKTLVDLIQAGGFVGLLIILAIPKTRMLLGFEVDITKIVDEIRKDFEYDGPDRPALIKRIPVICIDIKEMRQDLSTLKEDVSYIRGLADSQKKHGKE